MLTAVDALEAIPDAGERARALGELLNELPKLTKSAREMRQQAVLTLREQGLSWAEIGALLGVHRSRARQIAMGESWRPAKSADGADGSADGPADAR